MSDFSDTPFVAGSLIGMRAFGVDAFGRLIGPVYASSAFGPAENVAKCYESEYTRWSEPPWTKLTERDLSRHQVAGMGCKCGYYAYFDGTNHYRQADRVTAIIEGYGRATVGSRGFRSEKAKLVALVIPTVGQQLRSSAITVGFALLVLMNIAFGVRDVITHHWGSLVLSILAAATCGVAAFFRLRRTSLIGPSELRRVAQNYEGIPTYPTARAALKAHPLTPPPPPTPATDENFWTRSVTS